MKSLYDLPASWFNRDTLPSTQLYVNNCPELQDKELNRLLTTWFGVLWPGNCITVASSIVKTDLSTLNRKNERSSINQGVCALRFVSEDAAALFMKLFNGLTVYYQNYDTDSFEHMVGREWVTDKLVEPKAWYKTELEITWAKREKFRPFYRNEVPHPYLLERGYGELGQHALWQAHFPAKDHESWPVHDVKIYVDPYSPISYHNLRMRDPHAEPLICYPDASYWDAIGVRNPWRDGTVRSRDIGCWVNPVEKQIAYEDTEFWSPRHGRKRNATLDQDCPTYEQARLRPARAYSRGPSRGPGGRRPRR